MYVVQVIEGDAPRPITRAVGEDKHGVLVIGESKYLGTRIATMVKAMTLTNGRGAPSHRAGLDYSKSYWGWNYARAFPMPTLAVRWWPTEHHKLLEAELLERYRWEFFDRPPLNASIGSAGAAKRDAEGWLRLDKLKLR